MELRSFLRITRGQALLRGFEKPQQISHSHARGTWQQSGMSGLTGHLWNRLATCSQKALRSPCQVRRIGAALIRWREGKTLAGGGSRFCNAI